MKSQRNAFRRSQNGINHWNNLYDILQDKKRGMTHFQIAEKYDFTSFAAVSMFLYRARRLEFNIPVKWPKPISGRLKRLVRARDSGCSNADIANRFGYVNADSAKSMVSYARKRIRTHEPREKSN